jgi:putative mycofactocin binding protein MftB
LKLDCKYRLSEGVKARPEGFGGLIYCFRRKALYVVGSPLLMSFLLEEGDRSVREMLQELQSEGNLGPGDREAVLAALGKLEGAGVIHAA